MTNDTKQDAHPYAVAKRERVDREVASVNYGDVYQLIGWGPREVKVLKDTVAPGISDLELALFAQVCAHTGLDPFQRQIYAVMRNTKDPDTGQYRKKMVIQTGIDGFRLAAQRTGRFAGMTAPQWCDDDGRWWEFWDFDKPPRAAKIGVYLKDSPHPVEAVVSYREFVQTYQGKPSGKWTDMPAHMLAKCAEAQALRKAFPAELGAIDQARNLDRPDEDLPPPLPPTTVHDLYGPDPTPPSTFRDRLAAPASTPPATPAPVPEAAAIEVTARVVDDEPAAGSEPGPPMPEGSAVPPHMATEQQIKYLHKLAAGGGKDHDWLHAQVQGVFGIDSLSRLTKRQASEMVEHIKTQIRLG